MTFPPIFFFFGIVFFPTQLAAANISDLVNNSAGVNPWHVFKNLTGCHLGENLQGVSKLKNYFRQFGYISKNNFSDIFDDDLETALRIYQRNFNLNQTGRLDKSTLEKIILPRCGVPDIINGSSSMNSQGKSGYSLLGVAHYTLFTGNPRWPQEALTYAFLPANNMNDAIKATFRRAFNKWASVTTLTFSESPTYESSDIKVAFLTGEHGDGESFDGKLGTLAHAFSPPSGIFHLDGDENWVINDGSESSPSLNESSSSVDLESVAVHEIGHLLGLGHSSVEEAIMYPTISIGTSKVALAEDDVTGIQELYGSNPNFVGSPTAAFSSPETNGGRYREDRVWWRRVSIGVAIGILMLVM